MPENVFLGCINEAEFKPVFAVTSQRVADYVYQTFIR